MRKTVGLLVAALVAVTIAWAPTGAGAAPRAGSITARMSQNEVDPGVPVYIQGQVIGANTAYVIVQRKMASGWYDRAQGTLDGSGRFSIRVRPTGTGIYAFRVVTAGRQLPSPTIYLRVWKSYLLYDQEPVAGGLTKAPITLDTRYYAQSLYTSSVSQCCPRFVEYNLGRRFGRFQSAVGIDDSAPSTTRLNYRVLADGVQISSGTITLGSRKVIDTSVSGVLRLRLELIDPTGQTSERSGWGNPKIKR